MKGLSTLVALLVLVFAGMTAEGSHPQLFFPLSEHTMAKSIGQYAEPICRTYSFTQADEQAISWMNVWRDARSHSVEWRWYYPEGRVYARSFGVLPPIDGTAGFWGAPIWSSLLIKGTDVERMPGNWKVDVIVDFRKVLTERFTISNDVCRIPI